MTKTTLVALSLTGILALNGCNPSGAGSQTISGKAIDPYLAGATVCLADDDRICLSDETSVTTDEQGNYMLTVSGEHFAQSHQVVVTGGTDTETNTTFRGSVIALHEANATDPLNVTPLTTWLVAEFDEANATTREARTQIEGNLSKRYDLNFHADVVAEAGEGNTSGLKVSVELARSAELLDANYTYDFYVYTAKADRESNATDTEDLLRRTASNIEASTTATGVIGGVNDVIDAVNTSDGTVQGIAQSANRAAQNIAAQVHGFVHTTVCDFTGTCTNDQNTTTSTPHIGG